MNLKDLTGLGEPLKRLIDVISSGVGKLFASYFVRKMADAKAYEIKTISKALKEVAEKQNLPVIYKKDDIEIWQKPDDKTFNMQSINIDNRFKSRIDFQQRRQQNNIELITSYAAEELIQEKVVPKEKPDIDWITRFFNYSQDINSIEMQDLWGRILSGEIKKPGTYSLRTLDVVRNLTKQDAEIFDKFAKFAFKYKDIWVIIIGHKLDIEINKFNLYPTHQFHLSELGLIYPNELSLKMFINNTTEEVFSTENNLFVFYQENKIKDFYINILKFTQIGKELISLIKKPFNEEYYNFIISIFKKHKCKGRLGTIKKFLQDGKIEYDTIKEY